MLFSSSPFDGPRKQGGSDGSIREFGRDTDGKSIEYSTAKKRIPMSYVDDDSDPVAEALARGKIYILRPKGRYKEYDQVFKWHPASKEIDEQGKKTGKQSKRKPKRKKDDDK